MSCVYKLIGCEILFREMCLCASRSRNIIDLEYLPKGLHDVGEVKMSATLQEKIDAVDVSKYEAILLVYGLCNYGIKGLRATLPLVVPRAHDCITLLMGSKENYKTYFFNNPGTMYMSSGWIERSSGTEGLDGGIPAKLGMRLNYEEYDEEEAAYLKKIMGDWLKNYSKYAFIDNGMGDPSYYEAFVKEQALDRDWRYEKVTGDVGLIQDLMDGNWDTQRFLVVPPGHKIKATYEDDIISFEPTEDDRSGKANGA